MAAPKVSSGHVDQPALEPPAKKSKRTKEPMVSGGASSSLGAFQPGTTPPATTLVEFRVVSFNFGIKQAMIGPPTMRGTLYAGYNNYCWNFARICDTIVQKGQVDLLFGCEVGGFRQGFRCTGMNVWDILQTRLGSTVSVAEIDNYIAVFRKKVRPCCMALQASLRSGRAALTPPLRALTFALVVLLSLPSMLSLATSILIILTIRGGQFWRDKR